MQLAGSCQVKTARMLIAERGEGNSTSTSKLACAPFVLFHRFDPVNDVLLYFELVPFRLTAITCACACPHSWRGTLCQFHEIRYWPGMAVCVRRVHRG